MNIREIKLTGAVPGLLYTSMYISLAVLGYLVVVPNLPHRHPMHLHLTFRFDKFNRITPSRCLKTLYVSADSSPSRPDPRDLLEVLGGWEKQTLALYGGSSRFSATKD